MKIEHGIHTFELYLNHLHYHEIQRSIDYLVKQKSIQFRLSDKENVDRYMTSPYFAKCGILLRMYQTLENSNGMGLIINPSTLLTGKEQPTALYTPQRESLEQISDTVEMVLEKVQLNVEEQKITLCQLDLTMNIWMPKDGLLEEYIRFFHKGICPSHFQNITQKCEREQFYMIASQTIAVKAYDKAYELQKRRRYPEECSQRRLLRLEVSLKRDALLRKLGVSREAGYEKVLKKGGKRGTEVIAEYLKQVFPSCATHRSYSESKKRVEETVKDLKLQEQMLFLLRKTSDGAGLTTAVEKLKKKYQKIDKQRMKVIWRKFDEIDVNPVTIPNQKKIKELPCIRTLVGEYLAEE